ncbi:acyltransferase [Aliarcobacter butzleri]|uniref:acyltransferase n=1 Tax=Aliarcobacter butzleri TaxID=28197 RepID=UPI0021B66705|nr:acyltransferase [Aliarcobacter butzleri]MCT7650813.1 acyltransferase [Aliarcobacter butzleri]
MKIKKYLRILIKVIYLRMIYLIGNLFLPISFIKSKFYNLAHPDFNFEKKVKLRKNITFYSGGELNGKLYIGENSFINEECFIDYSSEIKIGKNVAIGMRTLILSSSHKISFPIRCGETIKKQTIIEDNCWIGAGVIIYPGVKISEGCVVAAGEIVKKDISKNKLFKHGKESDIKGF